MINLTCSVSREQRQEVNPELLIPSPRLSLLHLVYLLSLPCREPLWGLRWFLPAMEQ